MGCSPTEPPGLAFSAQALLAVKSVSVDEDPETEVPTHPEDGVPPPGNSKVRGIQVFVGPGGWVEVRGLWVAGRVEVYGEVGPASLSGVGDPPSSISIMYPQVWRGHPGWGVW